MATDTRSGFRLPWANAAPDSDEAVAGETSVPEEAQEPDMIETAAIDRTNHHAPSRATRPSRRSTPSRRPVARPSSWPS